MFATCSAAAIAFVLAPSLAAAQTLDVNSSDWAGIRAAYDAGRHAIVATEQGHHARTPGQAWSTEFDARAFETTPDNGGWSWGLELTHFGVADAPVFVGEPLDVHADGQRLARRWSLSLTEWYVNDARGLEHGFTVHAPPSAALEARTAPSDLLTFDLTVRGDLTPRISSSGRDVAFLADTGHVVVNYAGLVAFDADGDHLAAHFESRGAGLRLVVDACSADYPLTIDPIAQQAILQPAVNDVGDGFGVSLDISGDTVVVGAPFEDSAATGVNGNATDDSATNAGAAYVFVRTGTSWSQQAYLKASNTQANDEFGRVVTIAGDTIVVATDQEDSAATGVNGDESDNSAPLSGAAYVFVRSGGVWTQQAYLKASTVEQGDRFGTAVALAGDTLAVGTRFEDSGATGVNGNENDNSEAKSGAVHVFVRTGAVWSQQAYLKASDTQADDEFGAYIAIDGESLVVGSPNRSGGFGAGAAYVFTRTGAVWSQQALLMASNADALDRFAGSVAIEGDTIVVGAPYEDSRATVVNGNENDDSASSAGAAYVFERSGSSWTQSAYLKPTNTDALDNFGWAVAIFDDTIVVSAIGESSAATTVNGDASDDSAGHAGAAYVFVRSASTWVQHAYLKASNAQAGNLLGTAIAIFGDTVVVGSSVEDEQRGAAHVFDLDFWEVVPGCLVNPATFVEPTSAARIGTTTNVDLVGATLTDGIVATYYGAKGVDLAGCGTLLSPTEELLLALSPFPTLLGFGVMSGGLATVPVTVPNNLAFVGLEVTLQTAIVDTLTFASELSNAIEFDILP